MNQDGTNIGGAYRRAAFGLAIAAGIWTLALLFAGGQAVVRVNWLIPIGAAILSILCFSLARKSKAK